MLYTMFRKRCNMTTKDEKVSIFKSRYAKGNEMEIKERERDSLCMSESEHSVFNLLQVSDTRKTVQTYWQNSEGVYQHKQACTLWDYLVHLICLHIASRNECQ